MILSGKEIKKRLGKDIIITPFSDKQLNPNSYNLRLHEELLVYKNEVLDMKKPNEFESIVIPDEGFVLQPNKLYLGRTVEYTETHNLAPALEGRSSIGRLGIFVHITAGFGNAGSKGCWTLEIACVQPVRIYKNVELCQILYHTLEGQYDKYESNKYQDSTKVQPSMLYKDFE